MNCIRLSSDLVEVTVQPAGGHIAPIAFKLPGGDLASPYSLPPWEPDEFPEMPPLLRSLRGDFFCFPFGVSDGVQLPHGETANAAWRVLEKEGHKLSLGMDLSEPRGKARKNIQLRPGHRALYQEHLLEGIEGRYNYGHHPILEMPEGVVCPVRINPFQFGQVYPGQFAENPDKEFSALKRGTRFTRLDEVACREGGVTSLADYPARPGFEDLVMITAAPSVRLGWTAVSFPGFVWLSLRDPRQFPSTLFWMSNGGRHQPPWNGRHRRRIGIEDVCSHFHDGAHISSQNLLADKGIPTAHSFEADRPVSLRHAQAVVPVDGQPAVRKIDILDSGDAIRLQFEKGPTVEVPLNWRWLLRAE